MKIDIPPTEKPRIVIIGGGFGGLQIAKGLKGADVQVVMLDKHNYHTFQPLLYQVATSNLEATSIAQPIRKIFEKQKNFYFRLAEVREVVPAETKVKTSISDLQYDQLVIATGSKSNYFENEGLIIHSMPMKTINEALDLRSLILQSLEKSLVISNPRKKQSQMNFVIAGGGPTGVELAGALGEMKKHVFPKDYPELDLSSMNIYLVQSRDRVLPALHEKSSRKAQKYLEKLGVEVKLNTKVLDYHRDYVQTSHGDDLIAKTLIWTAGVVGAPIEGLNCITKGNRIQVNEFNQVIGHENIYAIGDVSSMVSEDRPKGHPMVAPIAIQQGQQLATNLLRNFKGEKMVPFEYKDKGTMATVGKHKAVVNMPYMNFHGAFAWLVWMVVHLFSLVGFHNKVVTFFHWTVNYFSSERGVRLILRTVALRKVRKQRKADMKETE